MSDDVPAHLRKFLPERDPGPTPAERFDAYLASEGSKTQDRLDRWRVRSDPSAPRTWLGFAVPVAILLAVFAVLGWRVIG